MGCENGISFIKFSKWTIYKQNELERGSVQCAQNQIIYTREIIQSGLYMLSKNVMPNDTFLLKAPIR